MIFSSRKLVHGIRNDSTAQTYDSGNDKKKHTEQSVYIDESNFSRADRGMEGEDFKIRGRK